VHVAHDRAGPGEDLDRAAVEGRTVVGADQVVDIGDLGVFLGDDQRMGEVGDAAAQGRDA